LPAKQSCRGALPPSRAHAALGRVPVGGKAHDRAGLEGRAGMGGIVFVGLAEGLRMGAE